MSLEEYAMTTSPFKSKIHKLATSGWAVTRKPRDQLALVVSAARVPSPDHELGKKKISLVSDNPEVLQPQLRRHSIKDMGSKHKAGPLGQSFGFLSLRTENSVARFLFIL